MKKLLLLPLLFAGSLLFSTESLAQNVVKVNLLSPIVRTGSFFFERAISENRSVQLGVFFTGYKSDGLSFSGYGITPEYRFYLSESPAPQGVYVAPFVRFQSFTLKHDDSAAKGKMSTMGGGVIVGKHWIFKDKISLDAFAGPSYAGSSLKVVAGEEDALDSNVFGGFGLRTGVTLGYKF